jgi:predicted nuclease of predicted toxin-antitoxin system
MPERPCIPFFTDQNVPDSVGEYLKSVGHQLTRLRDVMAIDTPDPIIEVACSKSGHVLLSHDKDFKQVSKRLNITQKQYRNSLHRIILRCPEPNDVKRISEALPLIELEWLLLNENLPMIIEIRDKGILISREFW